MVTTTHGSLLEGFEKAISELNETRFDNGRNIYVNVAEAKGGNCGGGGGGYGGGMGRGQRGGGGGNNDAGDDDYSGSCDDGGSVGWIYCPGLLEPARFRGFRRSGSGPIRSGLEPGRTGL